MDTLDRLMRLFVNGNYIVDLTESSDTMAQFRDVLDGDCVWVDPADGRDYDFGADLFWSEDHTRVVIIW